MKILNLYRKTHQLIKNDATLLEKLKDVVSACYGKVERYFPTGLQTQNIFLGLDFNPVHVRNFTTILHNTIAIDQFSHQQADLSRVLMKVFHEGNHIANLTEDVSENGAMEIYDDGILWGPYEKLLRPWFKESTNPHRAIFVVHKKQGIFLDDDRIKNGAQKVTTRLPIIDLDHLELKDGYREIIIQKDESNTELFALNLK